jgi:tRNA pseudouridine13 synthase
MNISRVPYISGDLPGTGGRIKVEPEDFVVEEIPLYEPCGQGPHVYLWVEKRGVSAGALGGIVARHFDVQKSDVGMAGNKDRQAVTRQWVSIPEQGLGSRTLEEIVGPIGEGVAILEATRHGNKLRTGHLKGNRFRLRIRNLDVEPSEALERAKAIVERLGREGMPNTYGEQRFGQEGATLALGLGLLRGDREAKGRVARDRFLKRLSLSAVQSEAFNRVLAMRLEGQNLRRILGGEVLQKTDTGGIFVVAAGEEQEAQTRLDGGEVVITGPMPGPKMRMAEGEALAVEVAALAELGIGWEQFAGHGKLMPGTRRPLIVYPEFDEVGLDEDSLLLSFALPSGSYATVLLGEITKKTPQDD